LTGALLAVAGLALPDITRGHGGTYRGPGDTVPPGGGGGGGAGAPSSPGSGAPSGPGPGGTTSPGPGTPQAPGGAPGGASGPSTSPSGGQLGPDLTTWEFWWAFNKEPYLQLRSKIRAGSSVTGSDDFYLGHNQQDQSKDSLRPSEATIRGAVVPALLRALKEERSNDIVTGALISLAKIGDVASENGESEFVAVISAFLASGTQEISETAALALGILADERSLPTLVGLLSDAPNGRKLVGGKEVPVRTRAFAAYGLGLIAYRTPSNTARQDIAETLIDVLEMPHFSSRDIKVGAMNALGLVPLEWASIEGEPNNLEKGDVEKGSNRRHVADRATLVAYLADYVDPAKQRENSTTRHWFVRAHGAIALGRLLEDVEVPDDDTSRAAYTKAIGSLLDMADKFSTDKQREVTQSATIAMGMLANSSTRAFQGDALGEANEAMCKRLLEIATNTPDPQSEFFALIALAQAGSRPGQGENRAVAAPQSERQLQHLATKAKGPKQPWAGLALGVFGNRMIESDQPLESSLFTQLHESFRKEKTPQIVGAYAIALGLLRHQESRGLLLERFLNDFGGSDDARGSIAVGLGLMEAREAIEPIQRVVRDSKYRPELLKQAAIALGLLGDKSVGQDLVEMLKTAQGLSSQAAIASALGTIGDTHSIDPLVEFLGDQRYTGAARGFAAVALGIVCDKEDLPWNTKLSVSANYRANTPTLTGQGQGILDIL